MTSPTEIRVKFLCHGLSPENASKWLRMFPGSIPKWGECRFIFDPDEIHYDWLVLYNALPNKDYRELLQCPKENTLFITSEPSSISTYGTDFLGQFGHVLTGQEDWAIKHPGKIHSQPALRWFYGENFKTGNFRDIDFMRENPPENKTNEFSTVCSAKAQKHTMHYRRVQFVEKLCNDIPELVRFGRGIRDVDDKAETLDSYRYHLAIENHICDHWWTEKLSDAFLGMTLPFYHGAPNAADYFPKDSFIPINTFDYEASLKTIRDAIDNNEYERRLSSIQTARSLILEKYNMFAVLSELISERNISGSLSGSPRTIYSRRALRRNPIIAVRIGLEKTAGRVKTLIHQKNR